MFHVGQRIVCVRDDWAWPSSYRPDKPLPRRGQLFTVREAVPHWMTGEPYVRLVEIRLAPARTDYEPAFRGSCFRPVTERKTDISVFEHMLVKGREPVVA